MEWVKLVESNRDYFQNAIIDMAGSIDGTKVFIEELRYFKFDLSNNMILYAIMKEPTILMNLFTIHQSGVMKRIVENITMIQEKQCTVNTTEQLQQEFVTLVGGRERALDFLKELTHLGLDLTQGNKLALMHEESESFKLLSIYYNLGFITKIINTQQAIEKILEKEQII